MGEFILTLIIIYFIFSIPSYLSKFFAKKGREKKTIRDTANIQNSKQKKSPVLDQVTLELKKMADEQKKEKEKTKQDARLKYEKKYLDLGLKKPKPNKDRSSLSTVYEFVHPIVPRILEYDIGEIKKGNVENTPVGRLLVDLIKNTKGKISDLKISGLNGYAKRLYEIKFDKTEKNKKYFDKNIFSKQIAKGYSIEFRPQNWSFHNKLKSYDDWFKQIVEKGEEPPPFSDFVKNIISPIGRKLHLKYKHILDEHCFEKLSNLKLSPPHGQKIRIIVYLLTSSKEVIYYNQNYLTDYGKTHLNKIAVEMNNLFKKKNVSLHHCYEDSAFREKSIRLAENNLRKKNKVPIIGEGWTSQTDLFNRLKKHFKLIEKEFSPKWIKPKRIDIYIKKHKVAIEYHGYQHYFPINFFGGEKAFLKRQRDDKLKIKSCLANKSSFIEWPYNLEINTKNVYKLKEYIEKNKDTLYAINAKNFSKIVF